MQVQENLQRAACSRCPDSGGLRRRVGVSSAGDWRSAACDRDPSATITRQLRKSLLLTIRQCLAPAYVPVRGLWGSQGGHRHFQYSGFHNYEAILRPCPSRDVRKHVHLPCLLCRCAECQLGLQYAACRVWPSFSLSLGQPQPQLGMRTRNCWTLPPTSSIWTSKTT